MRIFWAVPVSVMLAAMTALAGVAGAQPSASALLRDMRQAESTAHYSGMVNLQREGLPVMKMRVLRDGFKMRVEWQSPDLMRGDVLVDDGQTLWRYEKAERAVFQTRSTALAGAEASGGTHSAQQARVTGTQAVAGRPAWIVTIARSQGGQRKIWIDKVTKLRLRMEVYGGRGRRLEAQSVQSISFGPQPARDFTFVPPPDAEVTRTNGVLYPRLAAARKATNWLRAPQYLPKGYVFESAIVDSHQAWLRYTNGLRRFSVFQERASGPDTPPQAVEGGWFTRKDGSRFGIIGAPKGEGKKIADSLG